jgi:ABC-type arginine transport system ATPase subunit
MIELAPLNQRLAALNHRFVHAVGCHIPAAERVTVGQALLMDPQVFIPDDRTASTNQNDPP